MRINAFFDDVEQRDGHRFMEQGYLIFDIKDQIRLKTLRKQVFQWSLGQISGLDADEQQFFDDTHKFVALDDLNDFRLNLIGKLNYRRSAHPDIYHMAREHLHHLVGNELAMQRGLNLSIQFPGDHNSLLPIHSDVWSGNSPYEVVFWLPLTDCYRTRSMYILPKPKTDEVLASFKQYSHLSSDAFYDAIKDDLEWADIRFGQGLIFWHGLIHGNKLNREPHTRWSINTRFKSLLSPYGSKELGESFFPITVRPATRLGYSYKDPIC